MRPRTIAWFEGLYLASLAWVAVRSALSWPDRISDYGIGIACFTLVIIVVLPLLLVLLVSRRRSGAAKWTLVALMLLGYAAYLPVFIYVGSPRFSVEEIGIWVAQGAALALLFTPSARAWLARIDAPAPTASSLEQTFE